MDLERGESSKKLFLDTLVISCSCDGYNIGQTKEAQAVGFRQAFFSLTISVLQSRLGHKPLNL